ncbi:MAG: cupredoxin domain-containing protein [Dehalococcoidia bacterium]
MPRFAMTMLIAAVTLAGAVAAVHPAHPPNVEATQEAVVSMQGNRYVPEEIAVAAGATVTWVNDDYESGEWHDAIDEAGAFFFDSVPPGEAFSFTFDVPGTYVYYCDLHEGMFGRVIVQ